jgi:ribosomal protein S12 methylthiotransferase accessory factor YcaO
VRGLHNHEKWFARGKSIFQNAHFHLNDKPVIKTHTDGIAAGNTMEEAIFHGLMEVGYHEDLLKDIEQVITILKSHGYERLIAVDLTLPEIGIPTVRIIVPGMEAFCFDKTRKGARLFRSQE